MMPRNMRSGKVKKECRKKILRFLKENKEYGYTWEELERYTGCSPKYLYHSLWSLCDYIYEDRHYFYKFAWDTLFIWVAIFLYAVFINTVWLGWWK